MFGKKKNNPNTETVIKFLNTEKLFKINKFNEEIDLNTSINVKDIDLNIFLSHLLEKIDMDVEALVKVDINSIKFKYKEKINKNFISIKEDYLLLCFENVETNLLHSTPIIIKQDDKTLTLTSLVADSYINSYGVHGEITVMFTKKF